MLFPGQYWSCFRSVNSLGNKIDRRRLASELRCLQLSGWLQKVVAAEEEGVCELVGWGCIVSAWWLVCRNLYLFYISSSRMLRSEDTIVIGWENPKILESKCCKPRARSSPFGDPTLSCEGQRPTVVITRLACVSSYWSRICICKIFYSFFTNIPDSGDSWLRRSA